MTPKDLYEHQMKGLTITEIMKLTGLSNGQISGRIFRYRIANDLPGYLVKTGKPPIMKRTYTKRKPKDKFKPVQTVSTFLEAIEKNTCRYIFGDPTKPDAMFCGHERKAGSSFCPDHHKACYRQKKYVPAEKTYTRSGWLK